MSFTVATFYKFVEIEDCIALRTALGNVCCAEGIKGTVLIAHEGINATISGTPSGTGNLLSWLQSDRRFADLVVKYSTAAEHPFQRLKVKIKPEIVTFGAPEANPARSAGTYVRPEDWNALIEDPEVLVLDTRNGYEVKIGTFAGAINPGTQTFSGFRDFARQTLDPIRTPKIAMFCTGGIRCEKASSYLKALGFPEVYHLQGGILKYLETVPTDESLWRGECFVFDERVALQHGLHVGTHKLCPRCGEPMPVGEAAGCCEA